MCQKKTNKQIIRKLSQKRKGNFFFSFQERRVFFQWENVPNKEIAIRKHFKDFNFVVNYLVRKLKV